METETRAHPPSTESPGIWTWIILAGLLILGAIVAVGSLALMSLNEQNNAQTPGTSAPPPTAK
jgi:hypothetical protein